MEYDCLKIFCVLTANVLSSLEQTVKYDYYPEQNLSLWLLTMQTGLIDLSTISDDCSKVHCPEEPKPCPSDSYRLPSITGLDQEESRALKACCPGHFPLEKCQCIPGLHCSPPQCPRGSVPKLVENGTGEPGRCCSKFQCAQSMNTNIMPLFLFLEEFKAFLRGFNVDMHVNFCGTLKDHLARAVLKVAFRTVLKGRDLWVSIGISSVGLVTINDLRA